MAIRAGSRLGPYEVIGPIGAGGMGEVYRARDPKLKREVAIKVLPEPFAHDSDRLTRFQREAEVLASLNHPHIATIFGIEDVDGVRALILELVEGLTLAELIRRGPLPIPDAIAFAIQIAAALEAAHDRGVVHRDLKPANVKVTPDGKVKVLDFGLAKAFDTARAGATGESRAVTATATRTGVMLGTPAYMSPEQARGQAVDRRSDVWAFGCVLYEMLTGRHPFAKTTLTDTLAAIVQQDPAWDALPAATPPAIVRLLRRCLAKDARRRLRDMADAGLELTDWAADVPAGLENRWRVRKTPAAVALAALSIVTGVAIWSITREPGAGRRDPVRFTIELQPDEQLAFDAGLPRPLAISRDGRKIVYGTRRPDGNRIYIREQHDVQPRAITGTEGGIGPFVSPDGDWLGFASGGFLRKIPIGGGAPQTITAVSNFMGGSWSEDDSILYASWGSGLFRVSAAGGTPQPITTVDQERGERAHLVPHVLPTGNAALFVSAGARGPVVEVVDIGTGRRRTLFEGSNPHYLSSGQLIFTRGSAVHAVPFDLAGLEPRGSVMQISESVSLSGDPNRALVAVGADGTLVYVPRAGAPNRLMWVDRRGGSRSVVDDRLVFWHPRLSPDGTRAVVSVRNESGGNELWVYDLQRKARWRLSVSGQVSRPIWTADGKRITFQKDWNLYSVSADDNAPPELVLARDESASALFPLAWSRDGQILVYSRPARDTNRDVFTLRPGESPKALLATPRDERSAMLSPDGHWIVYAALEPGREEEIFVQPFPGPGERLVVSRGGGREPSWSPGGTEIFYRSIDGRRMLAVDISTEPAPRLGPPRTLFEGEFQTGPFFSNYDVAPDATQFLMVEAKAGLESRLHVVLHWPDSWRRP